MLAESDSEIQRRIDARPLEECKFVSSDPRARKDKIIFEALDNAVDNGGTIMLDGEPVHIDMAPIDDIVVDIATYCKEAEDMPTEELTDLVRYWKDTRRK